MKGTLFSADFVQDSNGNLRLLELNTDTGLYSSMLTHFDYTDLHNIISSSNITNFHVISKKMHEEFVTHLSQSLASEGVISNFASTVEEDYTIYPTVVADAEDKFILRLAYDESTVFDSTYCKDNVNIFKLFIDNSNSGSVAEIYHSGSDAVYDTLRRDVNGSTDPDVVRKRVESNNTDKVQFIKVQGTGSASENVNDYISGLDSNYFISNYYVSSGSSQKSYRSFSVVYGTNLEVINLASVSAPAMFDKPASLTLSGSVVDDKHFYELSTNYPFFQPNDGYGGIFEEESITDADGNAVLVPSASIGSAYKSYFVSGSPDTDLVSVFANWSHDGSSVPSGSYVTSSVLTNSVRSTLNKKMVQNLTISGGASIRLTGNQHLLVYDSGSDQLKYKEAYKIDTSNDQLFKLDGSLIEVTGNDIEVLNETAYAYLLDMEDVDTYVVHEADLNLKVVAHNACFPAGTKISLVGGGHQNIETLTAGVEVITYNRDTNEWGSARVGEVNSSVQNDLLEITTETGENIKCTPGHVMLTSKGWKDAKDLRVGDFLFNNNGHSTAITELTEHEGQFEVFHLMNVGENHTYLANNLVVHNYSRAGGCFIDGTEVTLASGDVKNIEDVKQGDEVLTLNEATGEQEGKVVYGVIAPVHKELVTYTLEDGTQVTSTFDHPYYVDGLGIKSFNPQKTNSVYTLNSEAEKIDVGDVLLKSDGSKSAIVSIDVDEKDENVQTTTLVVEDNHNFYANGVLVHNKF